MAQVLGSILPALAAVSCNAYSDGTREPDAGLRAGHPAPQPKSTASAGPTAPEHPVPGPPDAGSPWRDLPEPEQPAMIPEAHDDDDAGGAEASVRLAWTERFPGYFTDPAGQPLYMFAGDVAGAAESACLGECAREWPPFDTGVIRAPAGFATEQFARIHRQDGAFQITYRGHPLYYRAAEAGGRAVTSDGVDGRWFVARDYLAFMAPARTFAPTGANAWDAVFLTDGAGRTLYVCLDDRPSTPDHPAWSSCDAACSLARPIFAAVLGAPILPSSIEAEDLGELVRSDARRQVTYRGWPLYYFRADAAAGATEGHNERAWRAIDPLAFGQPALPEAD